MAEFSPDVEMQKITDLTQEFFEHVLYDEEPLFISDEATIWDVSSAPTAEELIDRISQHYKKLVTTADLKQPLWKLIRQLNEDSNRSKPKQLMS